MCVGVRVVTTSTDKDDFAKINVLVVHCTQLGFDLLLGIEAIKALEGIVVGATGSVQISDRKSLCVQPSLSMNQSSLPPLSIRAKQEPQHGRIVHLKDYKMGCQNIL